MISPIDFDAHTHEAGTSVSHALSNSAAIVCRPGILRTIPRVVYTVVYPMYLSAAIGVLLVFLVAAVPVHQYATADVCVTYS